MGNIKIELREDKKIYVGDRYAGAIFGNNIVLYDEFFEVAKEHDGDGNRYCFKAKEPPRCPTCGAVKNG